MTVVPVQGAQHFPNGPAPTAARNLSRHIIIGVVLAVLTVITTTGVLLWQLRQYDIESALADLTAFDLVLAAQTERSFESVDLVVADTIDDLRASDKIDPATFRNLNSDEHAHRFLSKKATSLPQLDSLLLIDAKGDVVNNSRHYPAAGSSVADRDYFTSLRDHPELKHFISAPVVSRGTHIWTIYLARRVSAPDGSFAGLVLGAIALDYFNNFYRDALPGEGRSATLWRTDGTLLARYPAPPDGIWQNRELRRNFDTLGTNGSTDFWVDGKTMSERRAFSERRLGEFPIVVTATRTEASILASWKRQATAMVIGAGILVSVILLVAWLMLRHLAAFRLVAEARSEVERESEARQALQAAVDIAQTALQDLKRSEERFRDIAEIGSDWIWETDTEHRFTMVAGQADEHLDLIGKTRWEGLGGDPNTDALWRRHKAELDSHRPFSQFRFSSKLPSGMVHHVMATGKPIFDDDGIFRGYRGTVTNETNLVAARERAERADTLLRDAIESLSEGFVIFDENDRYVTCNDAYQSLYPGSAELMIPGRPYEEILRNGLATGRYPSAVGREDEWIKQRLTRHRNPGQQVEMQLADGTWLLVSERRMANGGIAGLRIDITAMKRVQQSLHDSQAVLNRAQSVSLTGSAMRYFEGDRIEWSDELYRIFGVTRETFKPRTEAFLDLIHPEDRDDIETELIANDKGLTPVPMQFRVVHPDGAIHWIYRDTQIWFDSAGAPIGRLSTYRDVTTRHLAELRQAKLERLLRDAIESISEGFVIFDPEDRLVICNEAYRSLYPEASALLVPGTPYEDILRNQLIALDDPQVKGHEEAWMAAQLRQRGELGEPFEIRMNDGRWILNFDRRMSDGGTAGLRVDITALKNVQQSLHDSEDRLQRTQRISHTGSVERDLRSGKVEWSDETYRIFGVTRETFRPHPDATISLIHPEDREAFIETMLRKPAVYAGAILRYRIIRPDGTERIIHSQPSVVYDSAGNPERIVAALTDVTENELAAKRQADLESQLRHSEKLTALGTLAGGIAHDLNNTLVPILALSKLLMREFPSGGPVRADLETILEASLHARDLVRQILAFSRKQNIVKQSIDLVATIGTTLQMLRASIPRTIELVEHIEQVPAILADNSQVQQVIVNLVTNAAHAIGDRIGSITVSVAPGGGKDRSMIDLSVTDTGDGMSEDMLPRIFEPFFTTKPVGEGTGLGLSVVHGIVTSHGGTIDIRSAPGKGSTFTVHLPTEEDDASEQSGKRAVA